MLTDSRLSNFVETLIQWGNEAEQADDIPVAEIVRDAGVGIARIRQERRSGSPGDGA